MLEPVKDILKTLKQNQHSHYSLAPVARRLSEIMPANKVRFAADCIGASVQKEVDEMNMGDILLLENLRFHKEEENNGNNPSITIL